MQISKSFTITDVAINSNNILNLSNEIYQTYKASVASHKDFTFKLYCSNSVTYTMKNDEYDQTGVQMLLTNRRVEKVSISFTDYKTTNIDIQLEHTTHNFSSSNSVRIVGSDETWVNGTMKTIEDSVSHWKKQPGLVSDGFVSVYIIWLFLLPAFLTISLYQIFLKLVVSYPISFPYDTVIFVTLWSFTSWTSNVTLEKFKTLYPRVELLVGPEHLQVEKERRKTTYLILSLLVLPAILNLIFK